MPFNHDLPRPLKTGAGLLAGVLLLGGTVGVANAAETDRQLNEVVGIRDQAIELYDRLDGTVTRARNAIADTTADQYDDPTLLDEITRTLDHYEAYDPHLPETINPDKVNLDAVGATVRAARSNAEQWIRDANTLIDRAVENRNLKTFHDAETRLSDALDEARASLDDSQGRVDSTMNRDALSNLVDKGDGILETARERHETDGDANPGDWSDMTGMAGELDSKREEVEADVAARDARIAAEQAAAAQAQAQAAVQASYTPAQAASYGYSQASYSGTDPYYSSYVSYSNNAPSYQQSYSTSGGSSYSGGQDVAYTCSTDNPNLRAACQNSLQPGGVTDISYANGFIHLYAQHRDQGGDWIAGLTTGQSTQYGTVTDIYHGTDEALNAINSNGPGSYLQTCDEYGNPIVVRVQ